MTTRRMLLNSRVKYSPPIDGFTTSNCRPIPERLSPRDQPPLCNRVGADDAGVDLRNALEAEGAAAPKEDVKERVPASKAVDAEVEDALGARLRALRATG